MKNRRPLWSGSMEQGPEFSFDSIVNEKTGARPRDLASDPICWLLVMTSITFTFRISVNFIEAWAWDFGYAWVREFGYASLFDLSQNMKSKSLWSFEQKLANGLGTHLLACCFAKVWDVTGCSTARQQQLD